MDEKDLQIAAEKILRSEEEISKKIVGQKEVIREVLISMLTNGNVLLEGVPGLGKTELVKTVARVTNLAFSRIQFTPDLMPADVTGTNLIIKENGNNVFSFEQGPIFANLVLADEINRATPKTQSALLEAMQEKTVTVGKKTYTLPSPFMVLATQNPIENEGTYPLPEAQLDRFMFKVKVDFPTIDELKKIMDLTVTNKVTEVNPVLSGEDILEIRKIIREIKIADAVSEFALKIVVATHPELDTASDYVKKYISCGASPRAAQAIFNASRALALIDRRANVSFDDIKKTAYPVLRHRISLTFEAMADGIGADAIISQILNEVK